MRARRPLVPTVLVLFIATLVLQMPSAAAATSVDGSAWTTDTDDGVVEDVPFDGENVGDGASAVTSDGGPTSTSWGPATGRGCRTESERPCGRVRAGTCT
jgi:hypothetical protein